MHGPKLQCPCDVYYQENGEYKHQVNWNKCTFQGLEVVAKEQP
jgi:hypothetical protein